MAEKFRNKYRSATSRLSGYDYTRNGAYFVTICTRTKIPCLGKIVDDKMILSDIGIIVKGYWMEIQDHFPDIYLDEFIIMPDHIHGIIIINPKIKLNSNHLQIETPNLGVSTGTKSGNPYWKSNSIGSIINQFKRICTIKTSHAGLDFTWQPRFYDRIIRSNTELEFVRNYIRNNVINWTINEHNDNSIDM